MSDTAFRTMIRSLGNASLSGMYLGGIALVACTAAIQPLAAQNAAPTTVPEAEALGHSPAWHSRGRQAGALYGVSVNSAGDVNGDGFYDVIVGAHLFDAGFGDEGAAFVYHGSASGLSRKPDWRAADGVSSSRYGWTVSSAGDVNGDGYDDVIVGAPRYNSDSAVFLYFGSANGLSTEPDWSVAIPPNVGEEMSISSAGDVNGDGYDDVIVGIPEYWDQIWSGAAFVYYGSENGLSAEHDWKTTINKWYIQFGYSVDGAGDVNGDGYDDVIVGAPQYGPDGNIGNGAAFLYYGSATGLSDQDYWIAESPPNGSLFGGSVGTAGDVNGDGYSDVIIGDWGYDNTSGQEGAAFVFYGSDSGLPESPSWEFLSNKANAWFGYSVGTAGDVNADGYDDIIVGAQRADRTFSDEGAALVFPGSVSGLTSHAWSAFGGQASAFFGTSVAGSGDVNDDGADDIIVGAFWFTHLLSQEGAAFLYEGKP